MKTNHWKLLIALLYSLFALATLYIQPSGDDWLIFDTPTWNLGVGPVYRPFEVLFSWVAINYPLSFPYFNHTIVLFCHGFNAIFLLFIVRKFKVAEKIAFLSTIYFLFSPSVMGAVTSIDGTNQTISTFYSLLGFFMFYYFNGLKKYIGWLFFTMIASMHKEIGITWFIGTPLLAYIIDNKNYILENIKLKYKALMMNTAIGLLFVLIYLLIRINTSLSGLIGADDATTYPNYTIGIGFNLIKNMGLLLASCSAAIDTVAFFGFPRNLFLVGLTIVLSVPFLILTGIQLYKKLTIKKKYPLIFSIIAFTIVVVSPHLVMGRCGELHAYSMALPYCIILAVIFDNIKFTKSVKWIFILFSFAIIITDIHKWYGTFINGYNGYSISKDIRLQTSRITNKIPESIKVINITYKQSNRNYSSFYQDEKNTYNPFLMKLHYGTDFERLEHVALLSSDKNISFKTDSIVMDSKLKNFEYLWIINKNHARVINLTKK